MSSNENKDQPSPSENGKTTQESDCSEKKITVLVYDSVPAGPPSKMLVDLNGSDTVGDLRDKIHGKTKYTRDAFDVTCGVKRVEDDLRIEEMAKGKPKVMVTIKKSKNSKPQDFESAVPTTREIPSVGTTFSSAIVPYASTSVSLNPSSHRWTPPDYTKKSDTGFLGLSNQGATCYMNSLIQALFMTPEFRNALYQWDFEEYYKQWRAKHPDATPESIGNDKNKNNNNNSNSNNNKDKEKQDDPKLKLSPEENEKAVKSKKASLSIPLQLQLLFSRLQFRDQRAVKTKDLTHSFGWTTRDAFTQHDVQELMRVLFDALEQVLQGTNQASLIKDLYQGEMKDYVKCTVCGNESVRKDSFLDLQLVIKGFGEKPIGSIEEALAKWSQAEKLEGENQYFCETCNKKVDAEKGLSLGSLPYILTLQLERFTWDFMREEPSRVKLNDYVTFPLILDMNPYMGNALRNSQVVSTVDLEEYSKFKIRKIDRDAPASDNKQEEIDQEEEQKKNETETNKQWNSHIQDLKKNGKYVYELFAILIHKGSTMGGHYYAYIKGLEKGKAGKWYEFDDTSVSPLQESELGAAFGEKTVKESHHGRFSMMQSAATAYMLIYRQIDDQNQDFLAPENIPKPIKDLMEQETKNYKDKQEEKKRKKESVDIRAFFQGAEQTISFHNSTTLQQILQSLAKTFGVADKYPEDCMRLRNYQAYNSVPVEPVDPELMSKTLEDLKIWYTKSVLLEVKERDEEFPVYNPQEIMLRVIVYDQATKKFASAVNIFLNRSTNLREFKEFCEKKFGLSASSMRVVVENIHIYGPLHKVLEGEEGNLIRDHYLIEAQKMYIERCTDPNSESPSTQEIERTHNLIEIKYNSIGSTDFEHSLEVSKKMPFQEFKEKILVPIVKLPANKFKVSRVNYSSYRTEIKDGSTSSLYDHHIMDGNRLYLEEGTPIQEGQVKIDWWFFDQTKESKKEQFLSLFELPVSETSKISEIKQQIHQKINEKLKAADQPALDYPAEHTRIREVFDRVPYRIYPHDKMLKDAANTLYNGKNLAFQHIGAPETVTTDDLLSIFVMHWHPDKFELASPPKEYLFQDDCPLHDVKQKLAKDFNIDVENIGMAKAIASWPKPKLWEVPELDWNRKIPDSNEGFLRPGTIGNSPYYFRDGEILLIRDNTVPLKEISDEEKKKMKIQAQSSSSSSRKEESVHIKIDKD